MSKKRDRRRAEQVPIRRMPRRIDSRLYDSTSFASRGLVYKRPNRVFTMPRLGIIRPRVYQGMPKRPIVRHVPYTAFFDNPKLKRVGICIKRQTRKEVLFAQGRAGFSGSAPKKHYRRTADSKVRC